MSPAAAVSRHRVCPGRLFPARSLAVIAVGLFLVLSGGRARAGQNSGVIADCSWSADEVSTDRSLLPTGPFPMYVRLHGVTSVRAIGIRLRWFPRTVGAQCYEIVDGASGDSCGVLLDAPPNAAPADVGYTGSIRFSEAPVDSDLCLVAWVGHEGCTSVESARFYVASLMLEDDAGEQDLVPIMNELTILGGGGIQQPVALQSSGRMWLTPGFVNNFHVYGTGFDSTTTVSLVGTAGLAGAAVALDSPRSLSVSFDLPETFLGEALLIAGTPAGPADTLGAVLSVYDTTAASGTGLNGTDFAMDKAASAGMWRKPPADSTWTFVPAVPDSVLALGPAQAVAFIHAHSAPPTVGVAPTRALLRSRPRPPAAKPALALPLAGALAAVDYDRTVLYSNGFEESYSLWDWTIPGVGEVPKWGRQSRVSNCAKVFGGEWSVSPVGAPEGGPVYCYGYHWQGAYNGKTEMRRENSTPIAAYKSAELSFWRWIDTEDGVPPSTHTDALFWFYSTDEGANWIGADAWGLFGHDRQWRKELLTLDTGGGSLGPVRLKFWFAPTETTSFVALPNDSGVFVDDIQIVGVPNPNITFWRPDQAGNTWSSPIVVAAHENATSDEPVNSGQRAYFRFALRNNSYSGTIASFRVVLNLQGFRDIYNGRVGPLAPWQTWTSPNIAVDIPADFCGSHNVTLQLDVNGEVAEQDEQAADNSYTRSVAWVQPSRPDLRISSAWVSPPSVCAGAPVTLHAVVQNAGAAPAGASALRYALQSYGQDLCGTGSLMGTTRSLAPGATDTLAVVVSSSLATTRWYSFVVDCANTVDEGCADAEANNAYGPLAVTWRAAGADLAVTALYAGHVPLGPFGQHPVSASKSEVDATAPVGTSVPVTITVKNVGALSTPLYWDLAWFQDLAHSPTSIDPTTLRYTIRKALAPGEDTTLTFPVTSSAATTWQMYAWANRNGAVDECLQTANNIVGPYTFTWTTDSLVVRGRFTFRDTGYVRPGSRVGLGALHPLRGARVEVWDKNKESAGETADRLLGTTCTDEEGAFALALPSRYDPERGPIEDAPQHVVDIYARVVLSADSVCAEIPAVTVCAWSHDSTWTYASPVHMDVLDAVLDLGDISPPLGEASYGHRSAMHIYDTILRGAQRMRGYGFEPITYPTQRAWRTFIRWDPGGESRTPPDNRSLSVHDTIYVVGKQNLGDNQFTPDEWDDYVLLHEYGHQLARMGGFSYVFPPELLPDTSCARHFVGEPIICPTGVRNDGLAWEEGLSMFLGVFLDSALASSRYWDKGFDGDGNIWYRTHDLEQGEGYFGTIESPYPGTYPSVNDSGPAFEGANAGALWDWVDTADDNQNGDVCGDHFADDFERLVATMRATDLGTPIDSLGNLYMEYQHRYLAGELPRARALFEVLCEHGFWKAGATGDTVGYAGVDPAAGRTPKLTFRPTPTAGPLRFRVEVVRSFPGPSPRIEIFDVAGRVLRSVETRPLAPGVWEAAWEGRTAAGAMLRPGVYFARCIVAGTRLHGTFVVRR